MDRFTPNTFGYAPDEEEPVRVRCDGPCDQMLEIGQDEIVDFEGEHFCSNCLDSVTTKCPQCGERDFNDHFKDGLCTVCQVGELPLVELCDIERDNAAEGLTL